LYGQNNNTSTTTKKAGQQQLVEKSALYGKILHILWTRIFPNIVGAATNTPLFDGMDITSDIHAEINAFCRFSQSTEGCTAYIPIHPCKRCFSALVNFGIRRRVCRRESTLLNCQTAAARNIEESHVSSQQQRCQMKRIYQLVNDERTDEQLMEIAMHI
jgi:deoxycytidylate deaminase